MILTGSAELNRNSFVPLYFQLAEALKKMLETGAWREGARFPSEHEIAREFDVSRTVIRPALDLLVGDGAIVRIRGSGTFVAPPKRELPVLGLVKALAERPDGLTLAVLTASGESPGSAVRHLLDLEPTLPRRASDGADAHRRPTRLPGRLLLVVAHVPWLLPMAEALEVSSADGQTHQARPDSRDDADRGHVPRAVQRFSARRFGGGTGAARTPGPVRQGEGGEAGAPDSSSPA